jgi:hypothetical protein
MGGTTLPILTQDLTIRLVGALATEDFGAGPAISAVDLSRSYVFIPGHESGEIRCQGVPKCNPGAGGTAGFNTDGQVQQFCVEMPTPTTMRVFRQGAPGALPAGPPGCDANWEKVIVVEHL